MAIAMVAMLAFGGTYAYFTDTLTEGVGSGSIATGKVDLTAGTAATVSATMMPGDTIESEGTVSIDATKGAYVGIEFSADESEYLTVSFENGTDKWKEVVSGGKTIYIYTGSGSDIVATADGVDTLDFKVTVTLDWDAPNSMQEQSGLSFTLKAHAVQAENWAENEGTTDADIAAALLAAVAK